LNNLSIRHRRVFWWFNQGRKPMKYKAGKLPNGNWAVTYGTSYYPDTESRDLVEVERKAVMMSIKWHQRQIDKIEAAAIKDGILQGGDIANILA
jgi:hypothetical protein